MRGRQAALPSAQRPVRPRDSLGLGPLAGGASGPLVASHRFVRPPTSRLVLSPVVRRTLSLSGLIPLDVPHTDSRNWPGLIQIGRSSHQCLLMHVWPGLIRIGRSTHHASASFGPPPSRGNPLCTNCSHRPSQWRGSVPVVHPRKRGRDYWYWASSATWQSRRARTRRGCRPWQRLIRASSSGSLT